MKAHHILYGLCLILALFLSTGLTFYGVDGYEGYNPDGPRVHATEVQFYGYHVVSIQIGGQS